MDEITVKERAYWSSSMDDAFEFMSKVRDLSILDNLEEMECLKSAVEESGCEVLFSDTPIATNMERQFFLRRGLIPPFISAAKQMNERGWILKVEDAYRTPLMQKKLQTTPELFDAVLDIVLWETNGVVPSSKFIFRRLLALIAYCPIVATHMSGSAIDISVFSLNNGEEIDRGAPYLEFSVKTPMHSPFISENAKANRHAITMIMKNHGFLDYPWEFWHYNQGSSYDVILSGDSTLGRYGPIHWDSKTNTLNPIHNLRDRLNDETEIRDLLDAAIERRRSL